MKRLATVLLVACAGEPTSVRAIPAPPSPPKPAPTVARAAPDPGPPAPLSIMLGHGYADAGPPYDPCTGSHLDLRTSLLIDACSTSMPDDKAHPLGGLEAKLEARETRVAPGGTLPLTLVLTNRSPAAIQVRFQVGDQTGPLDLETRDQNGAVLAPPPGDPDTVEDPALHCERVDCMVAMGQVTLPPGGEAHALLQWSANSFAWPGEKRLVGCCRSHVEPFRGAPLAPDRYQVRALLPFFDKGGPKAELAIDVTR